MNPFARNRGQIATRRQPKSRKRSIVGEALEPRRLLHAAPPTLPFSAGLVARFAGDGGVSTIGNNVTGWDDQSGSGNHLSVTNDSPTILHSELNGHDVISFDGINDALGRSGLFNMPTGNSDRSVFMLVRYEDNDTGGFQYGNATSNRAFGLQIAQTGRVAIDAFGANNEFRAGVVGMDFGWMTQGVIVSGNQVKHYTTGNQSDTFNHTFNTGSDLLRIGTRVNNSGHAELDVAEILVFDRALSESEREQLENYFRSTYLPELTGFTEEMVTSANAPISLDFLPDGRMLIAQKGGLIKIGDPQATPMNPTSYLNIANVDSVDERGLITVVVDPDFTNTNHIFVYYSNSSAGKFRISRFTHTGNTADPNSETVIWEDNEPWQSCCHYGGAMDFGPDGKLYLAIGEEFDPDQADDLTKTGGKVIRINKDGTIPPDNPYVNGTNGELPEIYAVGMRNPFRGQFDDTTGNFLISEVGGNVQATASEDVHSLDQPGENFGWPNHEGVANDPAYDDPIFNYIHNGVGASIIGGPVYQGSGFPASFQDAYFYGDFARSWIRYVYFDANQENAVSDFGFSTGSRNIVDLKEGPDGALYYANIFNGVYRIRHDGVSQPPVINSAGVDVNSGAVPLTVNFQVDATTTGAANLSYLWQFDDGSTSTAEDPSHTYTSPGLYQAQVFVTNEFGTTGSDFIEVAVGVRPTVTIDTPILNSLFVADDLISYSATGNDPDGTLTNASYTWDIDFIHNEHTHIGLDDAVGASGTFHIPTSGHDYGDTTGYRFSVTVTDSDGLTATDTVEIWPDKVDITVDSSPSGLIIDVDGIPRQTPFVLDTLIGFEHQITAGSGQCIGATDTLYNFDNWSNGGDAAQTYVVPAVDSSLTANFAITGTCSGVPVANGLVFHVQGDSGVATSGTDVTLWQDLTGNNNDLIPAGDQPTLLVDALNGHDVIAFDGVNDGLGLGSATALPLGASDRSVFMVVEYDSNGWGGFAWGNASPNQAFGLGVSGTGNGTPGSLFVQGWGSSNDEVSGTMGNGAGWLTHSAIVDSNSLTHYADGNVIDTATHAYATVGGLMRLGTELSDTTFVDMNVAEILVYDRAVTELERQQIENYLYTTYFVSNTPPVAVADSYTTTVGSTIDTVLDGLPTVLANDTDAENDPLSSILVSTPSNGSLVFNTDGTFTYVHDGSNTSSDSFSYYADDGLAQSDSVTVSITIEGGNEAPVANDDSYATSAGGTIDTVLDGLDSVLVNDTDPDTDPLTAVLVNGPTNGTLTLNANGSFVYTHDGGPTTTDSFTYRADDTIDVSNIATVTITVSQGSGELPVTSGLVFRVQGDTGVGTTNSFVNTWDDISGTGNDLTQAVARPRLVEDALNGHDVVSFDGFNDGLGVTPVGLPGGNDDRTAFMVVQYHSIGDLGFSYGANSTNRMFGLGVSSSAPGNLTLESGVGTANVFESNTLGTGVGWMVQSVVLGGGQVTHYQAGQVIDTFTHTFNTNAVKLRLGVELNNANATQMDVAEILVYDRAVSETERQQIEAYLQTTYFDTNFAPIANDESYATANAGTINTAVDLLPSVLANDTDANNDPLTAVLVAGPSNGSLTLNADGSFVYTHNGSATTTDSFTYRASDGSETSNIATVTINVSPGNTPPVANNETYATANGGTIDTVAGGLDSVLENDTDSENDPLTAVLISGPTNGSLTLNSNGSFVYTHNGSATTTDSFTYQADDGSDRSNTATVTINVSAGNTAPVANNDAYATTTGGTIDTVANALPDVLSNDTDTENDPLTSVLVTGPSNGTLSLSSNGEFVYTHNGGSSTSDSFTYRANDGTDVSNVATVTIAVSSGGLPVTNGLVFHVDADMGVSASGPSGDLVDSWDDLAGSNDLIQTSARPRLVADVINGHDAVSFDGVNDGLGVNTVSGFPAGNDDRSVFMVVDYGANSQGGFSFGQSASNRTFGLGTAAQGTAAPGNLEVRGRGPANDFISNTVGNGAGWLVQSVVLNSGALSHYKDGNVIDTATHTYNTVPAKVRVGSELNNSLFSELVVAEILVYDRALSESERLQVEAYLQQSYFGTNVPPVANDDGYSTVNGGTIDIVNDSLPTLLANDTDADNDPMTSVLVSGPANGSLSLNANGTFVYTHNGSSTTTDSFTYQASDGASLSNTATVTINIAPANDPPVAADDSYATISGGTVSTTLQSLPKVLDNDTDADNDPLVASLISSPTNGTLSFNSDGSFTYVHDGSATTVDTFTYQANDGTDPSNTATVTIDISQDLPVTSGLSFRVRGDEGVTVDGNSLVSGWEDITANTNDLVTFGGKPTLVPNALNGHDVISFDGVNDGLGVNGVTGLPAGNSDRSVFMVVRYDSSGWGGFAYGAPSPNRAFGLGVAGAGNGLVGGLFVQGWGPSNDYNSNTLGNGIGWITQSVIVDSNSFVHYADGNQIGTGNQTYATLLERLRLGVELNDGNNVDMEVAEILIYDRAVSETERQQIESYLDTTYLGGSSGSLVQLDFNNDGMINGEDLDWLSGAVSSGATDSFYDLDGSSVVDADDVYFMVESVFNTSIGDSNLDGYFNPDDIVQVFQHAEYEDGIEANSVWSHGDWNSDGEFDSADIIVALQAGGYTTDDEQLMAVPATLDPFSTLSPQSIRAALPNSVIRINLAQGQEAYTGESMLNAGDDKQGSIGVDLGRVRHQAEAYLPSTGVDTVFGEWDHDDETESRNSESDDAVLTLALSHDDKPFV